MHRRLVPILAVLAAFALIVPACGGDDGTLVEGDAPPSSATTVPPGRRGVVAGADAAGRQVA
jgi:hypothetical protein